MLKVTFDMSEVIVEKVTFSGEKVTFSGEKVIFSGEKVTFSVGSDIYWRESDI